MGEDPHNEAAMANEWEDNKVYGFCQLSGTKLEQLLTGVPLQEIPPGLSSAPKDGFYCIYKGVESVFAYDAPVGLPRKT